MPGAPGRPSTGAACARRSRARRRWCPATRSSRMPAPASPRTAVARAAKPRADGRVELVGLSKEQIRAALEAAGLEPNQAKLRSKQIWHWIYNRGVSEFASMSDIAKPQRPWFADRFVISRPEVVEAQES